MTGFNKQTLCALALILSLVMPQAMAGCTVGKHTLGCSLLYNVLYYFLMIARVRTTSFSTFFQI